jgi:hypothetical protein
MFAACAAAIAVWGAPKASAQSFFEQLFGLNKPAPPQLRLPPPVQSLPPRREVDERTRADRSQRERPMARLREGRSVQTMCVRVCDGYYWPLRYPAYQSDFRDDAARCQAECGSETRLYTRSGPGEDAEGMRDMDGTSYGASSTAFAYRKGLVNGCACKPMPWSDSERARHENYALVEAETKLRIAEAQAAKIEAAKVAAAEQARLAQAATGTAAADPDEPPLGPAETALLTAQARRMVASDEPRSARQRAKRIAEPDLPRSAATSKRQGRDRADAPVRVAAAPVPKPTLFGAAPKFTYPGDR